MDFCQNFTDIHGAKMMNANDCCDLLTFLLAPTAGPILKLKNISTSARWIGITFCTDI